MNRRNRPLNLLRTSFARLGCLVVASAALLGVAQGQGSLPTPPAGFTWQSQGVMVYTDSGAFTVDLGQDSLTGIPGQTVLSETIQLSAYDATPWVNQHVIVHSSSYSVSLSGLGSVVVINMDGVQGIFSGSVGLNGWSIGGAGAAGPQSDGFSNNNYVLEGGTAGLFDDGAGRSGLEISMVDGGAAPTSGGALNFNFNGTYNVGINATILDGQWFGTGSAHGNASVQTVYERYDLVAVPEPSVLLLLLCGVALVLRRQRG